MNAKETPTQEKNWEEIFDGLDIPDVQEAAPSVKSKRRKRRRRGIKSGPPELQESSDEEPAEIPKSEEASVDEESEPDEDFK